MRQYEIPGLGHIRTKYVPVDAQGYDAHGDYHGAAYYVGEFYTFDGDDFYLAAFRHLIVDEVKRITSREAYKRFAEDDYSYSRAHGKCVAHAKVIFAEMPEHPITPRMHRALVKAGAWK